MNKIVEELKKVKVFYVATVDGNGARVRPFSSVCEFEGNAYICTSNQKDFFKQITATPNIELCGSYDQTSWLRVKATATLDDRVEARRAMLSDPTGPSMLYTENDGKFVVFRLDNIEAVKYSFFSEPTVIEQ